MIKPLVALLAFLGFAVGGDAERPLTSAVGGDAERPFALAAVGGDAERPFALAAVGGDAERPFALARVGGDAERPFDSANQQVIKAIDSNELKGFDNLEAHDAQEWFV